jgi:hypothetical protein
MTGIWLAFGSVLVVVALLLSARRFGSGEVRLLGLGTAGSVALIWAAVLIVGAVFLAAPRLILVLIPGAAVMANGVAFHLRGKKLAQLGRPDPLGAMRPLWVAAHFVIPVVLAAVILLPQR